MTDSETLLGRLYESISKDAEPEDATIAAYALEVLGNFLTDVNRIANSLERIAKAAEDVAENSNEVIGYERTKQ